MIDRCVEILGEPFFRKKNCAIFHMDCVKGMKALRENNFKVNLTLTSPPYNIGICNKKMDSQEYVSWCEKWMGLVYDITSKSGAFMLNVGHVKLEDQGFAVPIPYLIWDKSKFFFNQEIVWAYLNGTTAKHTLSSGNQKWLWYVKDAKKHTFNLDSIRDPKLNKRFDKRNNVLGKNPSDVWTMPKSFFVDERTKHPAQFPERLVERVIRGFSDEEDVVLDPFMGSGSTAVVSIKNDRTVIGFEINKEFCKIAKKRIQKSFSAIKRTKRDAKKKQKALKRAEKKKRKRMRKKRKRRFKECKIDKEYPSKRQKTFC
jgi:adenine-specific DNA-methyltransferase